MNLFFDLMFWYGFYAKKTILIWYGLQEKSQRLEFAPVFYTVMLYSVNSIG